MGRENNNKTEALVSHEHKHSYNGQTHTHTHKQSDGRLATCMCAQLHTAERQKNAFSRQTTCIQAPKYMYMYMYMHAYLANNIISTTTAHICMTFVDRHVYKHRHMCICTCTCMWHVITIHAREIGHVEERWLHMFSGLN